MRPLNAFMMLKIIFLNFLGLSLFAILPFKLLLGQTQELHQPIALPLAISGSFGEIRSDHFHSGIDFRTNGKSGYRVYASDKGFVSRIKVSPVGFGKTIYIEHSNGLTTVYAHLDRFTGKIAKYVEQEQYNRKSFEIELFPKRDELTVEKGEIIALSGNSGSSGGPHLHYEVRHTSTQVPMAPLKFFTALINADTSAPKVSAVYLYHIDSVGYLLDSLNRKNLKFVRNRNEYRILDTLLVQGKIGFGVESFDFVNAQSTRCGFSEISQFVNDQLTYKLNLDSFAFSETKYVNSIIDYRARISTNNEIVKLWADCNNKFSGLQLDNSNGFIAVEANRIYNIHITLNDHYSNYSTIDLTVKGIFEPNANKTSNVYSKGKVLEYNKEHSIQTEEYDIEIPKNALYHDIIFSYSLLTDKNNQTIYKINSSKVPIHKRYNLRLKQLNINPHIKDKYYVGYITDKGIEYCKTNYADGMLEVSCSKFGEYMVFFDTIPPRICPLNIANKQRIGHEKQIKFKLEDDTKISKYEGFIDNEWSLFEWDPKSSTLSYNLNASKTKKNSWHTLHLVISDDLNNKSEFKCEFFW